MLSIILVVSKPSCYKRSFLVWGKQLRKFIGLVSLNFYNDNSILWLMINCTVFKKILISNWGLAELLSPFLYVLQMCEQISTDN